MFYIMSQNILLLLNTLPKPFSVINFIIFISVWEKNNTWIFFSIFNHLLIFFFQSLQKKTNILRTNKDMIMS